MTSFKIPGLSGSPPPPTGRRRTGAGDDFGRPPGPGIVAKVAAVALALVVLYGVYFWTFRRVSVGPDQVLVLLRKDGGRSLPGDQVVIPARPDEKKDAAAAREWDELYE